MPVLHHILHNLATVAPRESPGPAQIVTFVSSDPNTDGRHLVQVYVGQMWLGETVRSD